MERSAKREVAINLKESLQAVAMTTIDVVDLLLLELDDKEEQLKKTDTLVKALEYCGRPGAADSATANKALKEWNNAN